MAASAYAFLVSLMNTMDQIQNHPRLSTCFDSNQFESLGKKVDFLLDFVENHSDVVIGAKVDFLLDAETTQEEDLLSRIALVAQLAEDIIEVEAADRIRDGFNEQSPSFLQDLQKKIEEMECIIKELEVIKVKEGIRRFQDEQPQSMVPPSSANPAPTMVGFDGYLEQLLDELTGYHSGRRILPIVGMGGAGKTTLARNAYDNLLTVEHFDIRVWVTVSQAFRVRDVLSQALSLLGGSSRKTDRSDNELGEELRKMLYGRRYVIVLDDVWSVGAWEKLKLYFPENCNRSRIVVTTRQRELVDYLASSALALDFLDDKSSWDLFCDKTFAQEGCPPQLQDLGKKIVSRCKGLPLAITVIGGLLGKSPRTQEFWEKIAQDKSLILEDSCEGNKSLSLLYLSYKHLHVWLKPCFLYLGLFPEDHQIDVSQLIRLLIAEGFIKANRKQSLEEVAESYIKDLVDRNLLLVSRLRRNKKLDTCYVHDLVKDLCMRIADKENFYCVQRDIYGMRHFIVDERIANFLPQQYYPTHSLSPSLINPLGYNGQRMSSLKSRLLRVLVDKKGHIKRTSKEINLSFLFLRNDVNKPSIHNSELPSSISLFWRLQTLICNGTTKIYGVELEIWKMPQLRHIDMWSVCLPHPSGDDIIVLQNLQTLKTVENLYLSEEVCKRIPNIKDLSIRYEFGEQGGATWYLDLQNLGCLNKLETLEYRCGGKECKISDPLQNGLTLPSFLKELSLYNSNLVWSDVAMIASLTHLEKLYLHGTALVEEEWSFVDEEFICLKHLRLQSCYRLRKWSAASSNFPALETLSISGLGYLEEIPSDVGDVPTLEEIRVDNCSESATMSAVKILEEQEDLGNESLKLHIVVYNFLDRDAVETQKRKIRELGFTCQNLHISCPGIR